MKSWRKKRLDRYPISDLITTNRMWALIFFFYQDLRAKKIRQAFCKLHFILRRTTATALSLFELYAIFYCFSSTFLYCVCASLRVFKHDRLKLRFSPKNSIFGPIEPYRTLLNSIEVYRAEKSRKSMRELTRCGNSSILSSSFCLFQHNIFFDPFEIYRPFIEINRSFPSTFARVGFLFISKYAAMSTILVV